MAKTQWKTDSFDPRKLVLDRQNPRIEVSPGSSQEQIRVKLLELEDVLDLARGIERNKGLFYGERIIVTVEDGKYVVLEGNRRVAACQMLLSPSLVPANFKTRFPQASTETKAALRAVMADISPDRAEAEPILTKRHTEQGPKPWSPVAKMRRAVRLLSTHSVEGAAQVLGTSTGQVRKLIRPYRLLQLAFELDVWNADERRVLEDEKLKTNPYTRLFTLSATKDALRVHFDQDQRIASAWPEAKFKKEIERIARDFLIPDPANGGKPRKDTRTNPAVYFADLLEENRTQGWTQDNADGTSQGAPDAGTGSDKKGTSSSGDAGASKADPKVGPKTGGKAGAGQGGQTQPQTPKASVFFENLECHVQSDILIKLANELRSVNHTRMPIAASLLLRATFEAALVFQIRKMKKWNDLLAAVLAKQKPGTKAGRDPGLSDLISFAAIHGNGVFIEQNMCKTLRAGTTQSAKEYLDAMTHMKFQEADPPTLVSVANNLRSIIQYILHGN